MRRLILVCLLLAPLAAPRPSAGQEVACNAEKSYAGTTNGTCTAGGMAKGATPHISLRPVELITALSSTPEVGSCTILASTTSQQGEAEVRFRAALAGINNAFDFILREGLLNRLWAQVLASKPGCPSISPPEIAFAFVREIVPPGPDAWIAPGYALTGKPSFVETRAPLTAPRRYDTPLGPLEVTLRATTIAVDWGDGTGADEGPFPSPGRPWPDGKATHTFTVMGAYDVVVTQVWDADWRLAGQAGTVPGLTSVGRLDGFQARQLQAVRNS